MTDAASRALSVPGGWRRRDLAGSAAELHGRRVAAGTAREVWVCRVTAPAVVLGSTQPADDLDADAAAARGVAVARRRSGGGLVGLDPVQTTWVDVVLPRGDPRWDDDIGRSAWWVGEAWLRALVRTGEPATGLRVHRGGLEAGPWSRLVCFAGRGPGEVLDGDAKVVGLSQRRTRAGARFQCVVNHRWDPAGLIAVTSLTPTVRQRAVEELVGVARPVGVAGDELVTALLAELPIDPAAVPNFEL